jgi:hypothetical protein
MTTLESGGCANCDRAIAGTAQKFCPACGQPTPAHRIDWHFLGHELEHSVLHMDRGILFSLKQLMLRPGHLIRDYLDGRRANQVKPLLLIMITAALVVFLTRNVVGLGVVDSMAAIGNADVARMHGDLPPQMTKVFAAFNAVKEWTNGHFALVTLLLLPFEAAAFKLAFRRFRELNYPEWLVITAFLTVQTFVIWTLLVPLQRWFPQAMGLASIPIFGYNIYSLVQFFRGYPRWKATLRALLGLGIFMLVTGLLMMATVAAVLAMPLRG